MVAQTGQSVSGRHVGFATGFSDFFLDVLGGMAGVRGEGVFRIEGANLTDIPAAGHYDRGGEFHGPSKEDHR